MNTNPDIRWRQRFQNFDRVFVLLRSAMENGPDALNPLEKEGVIQCFECFFELAWKTMKDYLEEGGFVFAAVTPRQVLKDAYAAKILDAFHCICGPLFEQAEANRIQSRTLATLSDTLLPELLSGELSVAGIESRLEAVT